MSQWGAQAMAKAGAGYREILGAFYPGAELVRGNGR
jgi:SpoIID/LytB domain protein